MLEYICVKPSRLPLRTLWLISFLFLLEILLDASVDTLCLLCCWLFFFLKYEIHELCHFFLTFFSHLFIWTSNIQTFTKSDFYVLRNSLPSVMRPIGIFNVWMIVEFWRRCIVWVLITSKSTCNTILLRIDHD